MHSGSSFSSPLVIFLFFSLELRQCRRSLADGSERKEEKKSIWFMATYFHDEKLVLGSKAVLMMNIFVFIYIFSLSPLVYFKMQNKLEQLKATYALERNVEIWIILNGNDCCFCRHKTSSRYLRSQKKSIIKGFDVGRVIKLSYKIA